MENEFYKWLKENKESINLGSKTKRATVEVTNKFNEKEQITLERVSEREFNMICLMKRFVRENYGNRHVAWNIDSDFYDMLMDPDCPKLWKFNDLIDEILDDNKFPFEMFNEQSAYSVASKLDFDRKEAEMLWQNRTEKLKENRIEDKRMKKNLNTDYKQAMREYLDMRKSENKIATTSKGMER